MEWLDKVQKGLPSMLFVPAREYNFKVSKEVYSIKIPRKGFYNELGDEVASSFFEGEFNILDDNGVLFIPSLTKVMLATATYPDLKDKEAFVPLAIKFEDDVVIINGNVIEMTDGKEE
jgi:hypothetical protein